MNKSWRPFFLSCSCLDLSPSLTPSEVVTAFILSMFWLFNLKINYPRSIRGSVCVCDCVLGKKKKFLRILWFFFFFFMFAVSTFRRAHSSSLMSIQWANWFDKIDNIITSILGITFSSVKPVLLVVVFFVFSSIAICLCCDNTSTKKKIRLSAD